MEDNQIDKVQEAITGWRGRRSGVAPSTSRWDICEPWSRQRSSRRGSGEADPRRDSPCHTGVSGGDDAAWLGRDEADLVPGGAQINIEVNDAPVGVVEHNRAEPISAWA